MASSVTPTPGSAESGALVPLLPFPQVDRYNGFATDAERAQYFRETNNSASFVDLNRRYIEALGTVAPPPLTAAGERVAADLEANGIALADFSEFFEPEFLDVISGRFEAFVEDFNRLYPPGTPQKGKAVYLDTVHKSHTFVSGDAVSRYLSLPEFAAISARYMRMVPRFVGTSFWRTRPATGDDRIYSQLWHRDYNDRMLVKVFLYLTNVGEREGYFEFFAGTHSGGPYGNLFDRIGDDGYRAYPDNAEVEARLADTPVFDVSALPPASRHGAAAPWFRRPAVVRCLGPRGSLIFADTFGLHRGGYVHAGHRDMVMTTYSTNFNVHKPHFDVTQGFAATLSPFMRMAFGVV